MKTLISVFDDRATARRAIERLVDAGFARHDLHLQEPPTEDGATISEAAAEAQDRLAGDLAMHSAEREVAVNRGVLESLGHFLTSLMGKDHAHHAGAYSEAVRRGSCVVVVDAMDDAQAEQASTLLHALGAVDVNDRAQQWRAEGWTGDIDSSGRDFSRPGVHAYPREGGTPLRDYVSQSRGAGERVSADRPRYASPERPPETLEERAGRVANERAFAFGDGPKNEPRDADGKPSR